MSLMGSVLTGMQSVLTGGEYRPPKPVLEEYLERIGRLNTALHRLEFWLRLRFLFRAEGTNEPLDLNGLKVGAEVSLTALTDDAPLSGLVTRYNVRVDHRAAIAKDVVELRNALAHARIYSPTDQPPFRLVRFARKPKDGKVEVANVVDNLDAAWFEVQRQLIEREIRKVWAAVGVNLLESIGK